MVFHSCSYSVEFFSDHSKAKFAKDLTYGICITNWQLQSKIFLIRTEICVSNYGHNVTFNERKVGPPALLRQFQMTLARLLSIM